MVSPEARKEFHLSYIAFFTIRKGPSKALKTGDDESCSSALRLGVGGKMPPPLGEDK